MTPISKRNVFTEDKVSLAVSALKPCGHQGRRRCKAIQILVGGLSISQDASRRLPDKANVWSLHVQQSVQQPPGYRPTTTAPPLGTLSKPPPGAETQSQRGRRPRAHLHTPSRDQKVGGAEHITSVIESICLRISGRHSENRRIGSV